MLIAASDVSHTTPAVLTASGELDIASAEPLVEAAHRAARTGADIMLDLSAVTFMDLAGLAALLHARQSLSEAGGVLSLRSPHERVRYVLELTGTERVFPVEG
jgi:anti-sigma B factor antagonist